VRPVASRRGGDYGDNHDISPSDSADYITDYSERGLANYRRRQALVREVQASIRCRYQEREAASQQARDEKADDLHDYYRRAGAEARDRYQEQQRDPESGRYM
jgi:hypothetical protein